MVAARVFYITVVDTPDLSTMIANAPPPEVYKVTRDAPDWTMVRKRANSKVLFMWQNGNQVRKWWDYDNDDPNTWANA